jgi:hypothetical protein
MAPPDEPGYLRFAFLLLFFTAFFFAISAHPLREAPSDQ